MSNRDEIAKRREAPLRPPGLLGKENVQNITADLNVFLADAFALYVKTKNYSRACQWPTFPRLSLCCGGIGGGKGGIGSIIGGASVENYSFQGRQRITRSSGQEMLIRITSTRSEASPH